MPRKKAEIMPEPIESAAAEQETKKKTTRKAATKTGTVHGGALNIRKGPDVGSERVGTLEDGTKIKILEDLGEWLRIDEGYVMAKWVTK